jgi:L-lactate dehydrogenase complex protein LldF
MSGRAGFDQRAAPAVRNAKLQAAVALATGRLLTNRAAAIGELADADALRDHARRIRAHTLGRLDDYLEQFASRVEALGGSVHWAATAADAREAVLGIARRHGTRLVVKSKSMLSEEVELNDALEAAGLRVVETDLGEFVVQLAHDRPSHIIAPILHRSRDEVAAILRERAGAQPSDLVDVASMTAFARRVLRREFLDAAMGISGVNFGVAETGAICTVTNEGNGRLTTSVPPVHVALMGIERVVPRTEDLVVMLRLLARSCTGQKLSVYSNVVTGPRRRGEPDGPGAFHVVLVDNGRSALLEGELAEVLYCIRCGACLNTCPVYHQVGGHVYGGVYSGPIGAVLTPGLAGLDQGGDLPHASTLCGACRDVCPVRIDLPRLLLQLRVQGVRAGQAPWWVKTFVATHAWVAGRPVVYRFARRWAARSAAVLARNGWISSLPGPLGGWTASRDLPAPARRSFTDEWQARQARRGRR